MQFILACRHSGVPPRVGRGGGGAVVGEGQCASDGGGGGGGGGVKRRRFGAANAAASDNNAERLGARIGVLATTLQSRSCF